MGRASETLSKVQWAQELSGFVKLPKMSYQQQMLDYKLKKKQYFSQFWLFVANLREHIYVLQAYIVQKRTKKDKY